MLLQLSAVERWGSNMRGYIFRWLLVALISVIGVCDAVAQGYISSSTIQTQKQSLANYRNDITKYIAQLEMMRSRARTSRLPFNLDDLKEVFPSDLHVVCSVHAQCLIEWQLDNIVLTILKCQVSVADINNYTNFVAALWSYVTLQARGQLGSNQKDLLALGLEQASEGKWAGGILGHTISAISDRSPFKLRYLNVLTQLACSTNEYHSTVAALALEKMGSQALAAYSNVAKALHEDVANKRNVNSLHKLAIITAFGYLEERDAEFVANVVRDRQTPINLRLEGLRCLITACTPQAREVLDAISDDPAAQRLRNEADWLMDVYARGCRPIRFWDLFHQTRILHSTLLRSWCD